MALNPICFESVCSYMHQSETKLNLTIGQTLWKFHVLNTIFFNQSIVFDFDVLSSVFVICIQNLKLVNRGKGF